MKVKIKGWFVGVAALIFATLMLGVSIWQYIGSEVEEQVIPKEATVKVLDQVGWEKLKRETAYSGFLPGQIGYIFQAGVDRVNLFLINDPDEKAKKLMQLADNRMAAVIRLMGKGKGRLALQTAIKGVFYWEEARNYLTNHDEQRSQHGWLWQQLDEEGERYLTEVRLMKLTLSEPAHQGIDRLIETLTLGLERVAERRIKVVN